MVGPTNRAMRTACETPKTQTLRNKGPFLPHFSSPFFDSQESVFKAPKRGQFHAAIRVTTNSERLRCVCLKCAQETDGIATTIVQCGIASETLQRNMPLRLSLSMYMSVHRLAVPKGHMSLGPAFVNSGYGLGGWGFYL